MNAFKDEEMMSEIEDIVKATTRMTKYVVKDLADDEQFSLNLAQLSYNIYQALKSKGFSESEALQLTAAQARFISK